VKYCALEITQNILYSARSAPVSGEASTMDFRSFFSLLRESIKTIHTTRNWYSILFFALFRRQCAAYFRDGNIFLMTPGQFQNYLFIAQLILDYLSGVGPRVRLMMREGLGQVLDSRGYRFVVAPYFGVIFATEWDDFLQESFPDLKLAGYEVIDVGACNGDTAIYFASKGAKVHAYEPVPEAFSMLLKNVFLNHMENVITAHNCAIGRNGFSKIYVDTKSYGDSSAHKISEKSIRVKSIDLKDALKICNPRTRKLLKLNCEGCEISVINASNSKSLRSFQQIVLTYHTYLTGIPRDALIDVLEQNGFRVAIAETKHGPPGSNTHGIITASRAD
jgi:FkbM family methyltransferase